MFITQKRKLKWIVIMAAAAAVFAVSAVLLILHFIPQKNNTPSPKPVSSTDSAEDLPDNPVNFAELQAKNPDICGWISIPNMDIEYPVLQSSDDAEDFYLTHNEEKVRKSAGAIYIQKINNKDFTDPNTVIYGHNMINGSMFGKLKKFRNKQFFNEHDTIYIYTPGHVLTYKIYSAFLYDDRHILNSFNFSDENEFASFINQTLEPSSMVKNVRDGVAVNTDSRIITLSTCTSVDTERYLVEGVLINDQRTK